MKAKITYIDRENTERAELYVKPGHRSLEELVSLIEKETYKEQILYVSDGKDQYQLRCTHLFYIESMEGKLLLHAEKKIFQYKKKLYEVEEELPEYFVRISKAVILNLRQVEHYSPQLNGTMKVTLLNKEEVYISRKYLQQIRSKIRGQ